MNGQPEREGSSEQSWAAWRKTIARQGCDEGMVELDLAAVRVLLADRCRRISGRLDLD